MATIDKRKFAQGHKKPWRARVMTNYRHVDLGYYATWDEANTIEARFREALSRKSQTGRWSGSGAKHFQQAYASARTVQRRSVAARAGNPANGQV